jgi:2-oxoglutarate ferredoxin oxidoreductase subunit alpha
MYVTGLTHDERGYPSLSPAGQKRLVGRLVDKIRKNADRIARYEEEGLEDADVVVVSYGITSRVARRGAELARAQGIKVGFLRLIVVWPFPENRIRALASTVRALVVAELNLGQMVFEVERAARGKCSTVLVGSSGGEVHDPSVIADAIVKAAQNGGNHVG